MGSSLNRKRRRMSDGTNSLGIVQLQIEFNCFQGTRADYRRRLRHEGVQVRGHRSFLFLALLPEAEKDQARRLNQACGPRRDR